MKVLFVDDEPDFLEQAATFLEKEAGELDVETAVSPDKGLELIHENDYAAVVSDYQMPEMNGLEFLEIIRKEKQSDIPFIIFTGKGREEVAMKALNLGADRYLQKGGSPRAQYGVLADAILQEVHHHVSKKDLKESEERYRGLFESAQEGILILYAESGKVKDANPYIQDLTGYSKEELVGRELWEIGTFRNIVENREGFEELVDKGFIRYDDLDLETKEGEEVPVEFVSNTYKASGEKVVLCNIRDISERKKTERERGERVKELSLLYNLSKIEDLEESMEKILDKAVNLLPDAWQYPEITCGRINFEDKEYKTDNFRETEWSLSNDIFVEGKKRGFVEVCYLDEKLEEDEGPFLKEEKELLEEFAWRLSSILENQIIRNKFKKSQKIAKVGSWEIDLESGKLFWSDETYKIFGVPVGETVDFEKFLDFVHPEDRDYVNKRWMEGLEGGDYESGEYELEHRIIVDGETKWVRERVEIRYDKEGEPVEAMGIVQDITEQKERDRELKRKEWYLDHVPDFIQVVDEEGNIKYRNRALEAEGILDKNKIEGSRLSEFVHPEDKEKVEEMFTKALENPGEKYTEVVRGKTKEGWAWFLGRIINYLDKPEVEGMIITGQNITERKEMEEELRESEEKFRSYVENAPSGVFVVDEDGNYLEVNKTACEMTGYSEEELLEMNISDLVTSEARDKALETFGELLETGEMRVELPYLKKDGSKGYWIINALEISEDRYLGFTEDISQRKKTEEREEFLHSLLRHDIRNKAQIVRGYLELLEDYDMPEEAEDFVIKAEKGIQDSMGLIEKVRTLRSFEGEEKVKGVNISSVMRDVIKETESQAQGKGMEVEHEEINVKVRGGTFLEEVFSNLIENSIKHSGGDKIRISSEETEDECIVIIEDDGRGIPDEKREKVFKKGYKSGDDAGSGLGMYLVKQIIESYDGSIEVKASELGGARFDIHLQKV